MTLYFHALCRVIQLRLYQKEYKLGGGLYFNYRANTSCSKTSCQGDYPRLPLEQDKKSYSAALLLNWDEFNPGVWRRWRRMSDKPGGNDDSRIWCTAPRWVGVMTGKDMVALVGIDEGK